MSVILRLRNIFLGLLLGLSALWALCVMLLPGVLQQQVHNYGQKLGYEISVTSVSIAPLRLQGAVEGLLIRPAETAAAVHADDLLKVGRLNIDLDFWPLLAGRLGIAEVSFESPEIVLSKASASDKYWNWERFLTALAGPESSDPSTLKVSVDRVQLKDARLVIRQGRRQDAFGPFSLTVSGYRNQGEDGQVGGLDTRYRVNLGKVVLPVPQEAGAAPANVVLEEVTLAGDAHQKANQNYQIDLIVGLKTGQIRTSWDIDPNGATINGQFDLDQVPLAPWMALIPSRQPLEALSGNLGGSIRLQKDGRKTRIEAALSLADVAIRVAGAKDTLMGWSKAAMTGLALELSGDSKSASILGIADVDIMKPVLQFEMGEDRVSNLARLFRAPAASTGESGAHVGDISTAPAMRYDIRAIRLKQGQVHFADHSIRPEFVVDVNSLNGNLLGISNAPNRYATLALDGRVGRVGSLRGRGQIAFANPRENHDVTLLFRNIPLRSTNPYVMTFAGYQIDDGSIDADLRYVTRAGKLEGKNRFVIRQIRLGAEAPDYQGARLPLGLAVALLEDSSGMIDVNIPVQGDVNDPEFGVGHLVWQAVKTVLNNVVTAPFRVLGTILGIENMDAVVFIPGESGLSPNEQDKLDKIAAALAKRPGSRIVVHGTYDPEADKSELARATVDQAILKAGAIAIDSGDPLPVPNMSDPSIQAAVKTAYAAQIGRLRLGQRLLTLADTSERYQQLRQEMIDNLALGEAQLKQLAAERAGVVQRRLQGAGPEMAQRVLIGDAETVRADSNGVAIRIDIERVE